MLLYMIYVLIILVRTKIVNNEYAITNMSIYFGSQNLYEQVYEYLEI